MNEWKECYEWLVKCRLIDPDTIKISPNIGNSEYMLLPIEIANALKDGTALCNFLNYIQDRSVIDYSQMARNSQCLMRKNIGAFLSSLKVIFHIAENDLFNVDDLYSKYNLNKVLYTLSILSQHQKIRQKFKPFVLPRNRHFSDTDDYTNIITCGKYDDEDDIYDFKTVTNNIEQERIYGRIMDIVPQTNAKKTLREMSNDELVATEEKFVGILRILYENFCKPLIGILSINEHSIIFKFVEKLFSVHSEFFSVLLKTKNPDSGICFSDCFKMFKNKFVIYGEYCSHIPEAQTCVDDLLKSNSPARKAIESIQTNCEIEQCKLRDLLVIPMQRVLRYQLLIKSCIDNSNEKCTDRKQLHDTYNELQDLALFVNEMKRDKEMLKNISRIENSILNLDLPSHAHLSDYGRLIKDGELKYKYKQEASKNMYIFLFDKVVLICKSKHEIYEYYHNMILNDHSLKDEKDKTKFVLAKNDKTDEWYSFKCKSADEKDKWVESIKMANDNVSPEKCDTGQHKFRMFSFLEPTICDVCKKWLRGDYFQGYKCKVTNMNVHKECISKTDIVPVSRRQSVTNFTPPKPPSRLNRQTTYVENTVIPFEKFPWYAGEVERLAAIDILENLPNGSYLVRFSSTQSKYVLGIQFNKASFILIHQNERGYYLEEGNVKPTIPDLLQLYEDITLGTSFNSLPTCLLFPVFAIQKFISEIPKNIRVQGFCRVNYDFVPMEANRLRLNKGDFVAIINKAGEANGWWKGWLKNKIAYFPCAYASC